jgi:DNA invertase Pin-like site-specific DNA recombinase
MRAVIYLRQSKDQQGTGAAVERQREDCERLARDRGWTVTRVLVDNDLSASNGKHRPGYAELLRLLDARAVDVVIAWHVDRLTRRMSELADLVERCQATEVRVATVTGDLDLSTDAGRLVGYILGACARGEVERKSERQKRAALQAAQAGRPPARRGFGFTLDGGHHPVEAEVVRELYGLVLAGMTLVAATKWLNERGHRTTSGKVWGRSSVHAMLLNPRNAGLRTHRREIVGPGNWEPIVAEEVFRAAMEKICDPARKRTRPARRWLGGGLYFCWCGVHVRSSWNRHGQRVYECSHHNHMSRNAEPIDAGVLAEMQALLTRPDVLAELAADHGGPDAAALRDEATALRLRLDQIAADYADGVLTGRQLQVATTRVEDRLAEVEARLADAGRGSALAPLLAAADPVAAWDTADLSVQRAMLDAAFKVTILPGRAGRVAFDPETVRIERRDAGG